MQSTIVPLYETFTSSTSILYGAGEPPLIEGRKYALQVQAIDANGYNIFDNNGYSPVHEFVYGKQCPIPTEFTAQKGDGTSIDIKWQANTQHKSYIVNYRQKGKGENKTEMVFSNGLTLYNLLPKTTYLISLVGLCKEGNSEATQELSITTDTAKSSYQQWAATNCGKPLPSIDLSNTKPLLSLNTGETIQAADFDIKIIAITSLGNGYYTGSGLVTLPFTGKVPLPCSFERILLNADKRMIEGKISLLQAPLMLSNRTFTNVAKMWRQLFGSNWNKYETQKYEGNINQINVNETDGTITIEGSAGTKKNKNRAKYRNYR